MSQTNVTKLKALRPSDDNTWMGSEGEDAKMTSKAQALIDQLESSIHAEVYPSIGTRLQVIEQFIHFYFTAFDRDRDSIYETSPLGDVFYFVEQVAMAVDVPFNAVDNSWDMIADATR